MKNQVYFEVTFRIVTFISVGCLIVFIPNKDWVSNNFGYYLLMSFALIILSDKLITLIIKIAKNIFNNKKFKSLPKSEYESKI